MTVVLIIITAKKMAQSAVPGIFRGQGMQLQVAVCGRWGVLAGE